MWIRKLEIENYRAFQHKCSFKLSKHITIFAGKNGIGKSTILAILTNVGELAKFKTLAGRPFRGEFSDVIMYDKGHDSSGQKATVFFEDTPRDLKKYNLSKELSFRATLQTYRKNTYTYTKDKETGMYLRNSDTKSTKRYRLIPEKNKFKDNERKVTWPSYYLGLSRLFPLGESINVDLKKSPINDSISKEIVEIHSKILSEHFAVEKSKMTNIDIGALHSKANIENELYGFASNSNGQDNTGQIIEAVLSFRKLKETLKKDYIGGILAIDEIDATLHPAAQNKLFDWLYEMSEILNLQIILTTHSLTMLEYISRLIKLRSCDALINYLSINSDAPGLVKVKVNPPENYYRNNLQETFSKIPKKLPKINVFLEDETARWFFSKIVDFSISGKKDFSILKNLSLLDVNISWTHMLNLFESSPEDFNTFLFILDPDMNVDIPNSPLENYINNHIVSFKVNNTKSNIFTLPGTLSIEQEIWNYIESCNSQSSLFFDPQMEEYGYDYDIVMQNGPISENYVTDKNNYKHWFNDFSPMINIVIKYWIRDHQSEIMKFMGVLSGACKKILSTN